MVYIKAFYNFCKDISPKANIEPIVSEFELAYNHVTVLYVSNTAGRTFFWHFKIFQPEMFSVLYLYSAIMKKKLMFVFNKCSWNSTRLKYLPLRFNVYKLVIPHNTKPQNRNLRCSLTSSSEQLCKLKLLSIILEELIYLSFIKPYIIWRKLQGTLCYANPLKISRYIKLETIKLCQLPSYFKNKLFDLF